MVLPTATYPTQATRTDGQAWIHKTNKRCYDHPFLLGAETKPKVYATFAAARAVCDANPGCGGVWQLYPKHYGTVFFLCDGLFPLEPTTSGDLVLQKPASRKGTSLSRTYTADTGARCSTSSCCRDPGFGNDTVAVPIVYLAVPPRTNWTAEFESALPRERDTVAWVNCRYVVDFVTSRVGDLIFNNPLYHTAKNHNINGLGDDGTSFVYPPMINEANVALVRCQDSDRCRHTSYANASVTPKTERNEWWIDALALMIEAGCMIAWGYCTTHKDYYFTEPRPRRGTTNFFSMRRCERHRKQEHAGATRLRARSPSTYVTLCCLAMVLCVSVDYAFAHGPVVHGRGITPTAHNAHDEPIAEDVSRSTTSIFNAATVSAITSMIDVVTVPPVDGNHLEHATPATNNTNQAGMHGGAMAHVVATDTKPSLSMKPQSMARQTQSCPLIGTLTCFQPRKVVFLVLISLVSRFSPGPTHSAPTLPIRPHRLVRLCPS